jgi:protein-S-isoprenylcysteine O-methyltransferase Ste14
MKQKQFIDSHKGVTALAIVTMMAIYRQWDNPTAWVYFGLHGTYGLLWVLKSRIFPDRSWEAETSLGYGLAIWGGLTLYWIAPWLLTSRGVHAPAWLLGMTVSLHTWGVFLHYAADMQKHTALKLRPGKLITDGLMARTRNINYFGELLVYVAYALLALHWIPFLVLGLYLAIIWIPYMLRKERSLALKDGYKAYRKQSKFFLPFLL